MTTPEREADERASIAAAAKLAAEQNFLEREAAELYRKRCQVAPAWASLGEIAHGRWRENVLHERCKALQAEIRGLRAQLAAQNFGDLA